MKPRSLALCTALLLLASLLFCAPARATRIKDLASLEGVRENQLMGYGLVIGLNGTGDDIKKSVFTKQAIANMVKRMGMGLTADVFRQMKTKNVAAVMVTARLPAFARPGTTIDILVSSIGDASSLSGGTLLMTPLKGPGRQHLRGGPGAAGRGRLAFGGKAAKVQKNFPTAGRITRRGPGRAGRGLRTARLGRAALPAARNRFHHRRAHDRGDQQPVRRRHRPVGSTPAPCGSKNPPPTRASW